MFTYAFIFFTMALLLLPSGIAYRSGMVKTRKAQRAAASVLAAAASSSSSSSPRTIVESEGEHLKHFSRVFLSAALGGVAAAGVMPRVSVAQAASAPSEAAYVQALAVMMTSKRILQPVPDFIKKQAYDNGRTNVKYLQNQLQLEKQATLLVRGGLEYSSKEEALEKAQEKATEIDNACSQLDTTIYTVVFIPSEDGEIPPAAEKYIKEIYTYLNALNDDLDALIAVGSDEQLAAAKTISTKQIAELPATLFKEVKSKPAAVDLNK